MAINQKRANFFASEEGVIALEILKDMAADKGYKTGPSYSANSMVYPNNLIPFVDKHMHYLRDHPNLDSRHYISNLRLMTKIK
jgi:hypothetical protein